MFESENNKNNEIGTDEIFFETNSLADFMLIDFSSVESNPLNKSNYYTGENFFKYVGDEENSLKSGKKPNGKNLDPYAKLKKFTSNKHTLKTYTAGLNKFAKFTSLSYDEICKLSQDDLQTKLEDFVGDLHDKKSRKRTILTFLAGIEKFLNINGISYQKQLLHALIQDNDSHEVGGNVPLTTDEIRLLLKCTKRLRTIAIILFLASTGIRPGAIADPVLRIKHLVSMEDCYAVRVYDESSTGYSQNSKHGMWVFLTPEARRALDAYLNSRKVKGEQLGPESPLFASHDGKHGHLTTPGLYDMLHNLYLQAGTVRVRVDNHRFDKSLVYGFRKRFNTILKMQNDVNHNIAEKLMGHKRGLDGTYLQPTREECFAEFKKAIPYLQIDKTEVLQSEIEQLKKKLLDKEGLPVIKIDCAKCGNNEAVWWMFHPSNVGEPSIQFYRCMRCSYTWKNQL